MTVGVTGQEGEDEREGVKNVGGRLMGEKKKKTQIFFG